MCSWLTLRLVLLTALWTLNGVLNFPGMKAEGNEEPIPEIPNQQGRVRLAGFRTEGGENFKLLDVKAVATLFGDDEIDLKIGGKPCTSVVVSNARFNATKKTWRGDITCSTPPNMGFGLLVTLSVKGREAPNPDIEVDYAPPLICIADLNDDSPDSVLFVNTEGQCPNVLESRRRNLEFVPEQRLPTTGGLVVVKGDNLGSHELDFDVEPVISIAGLQKSTEPQLHEHHQLQIPIPPGAGGTGDTIREAKFLVSNFRSEGERSPPSFTFKYMGPSIDRMFPSEIPTRPDFGYTIFIIGDNFGPPQGTYRNDNSTEYVPEMSIEFDMDADGNYDDECKLVGSNHTVVECEPPKGQGDEITVRVIVDHQEHEVSALDYKKPVVYAIFPTSGPTSGRTSDDMPVEITMEGENFGVKGMVEFQGATYEPLLYTHSKVVFYLPEGYGENASLSVIPSGFRNSDGSSNEKIFSFNPPVVEEVYRVDGYSRKECDPIERCTTRQTKTSCIYEYPDCFPTNGGVRIEVEGNNFGPITFDENGRRLPVVELELEGYVDRIGEVAGSEHPHTNRFFVLPEGVGSDLLAQVAVSEWGSEGRVSGVNESAVLSYDPPRINRIMPNNPNAVGESIDFRGANFGSGERGELHIKVGNQTCKNAFIKEAHTFISCEMPRTTVGPKRIELNVAKREKIFPVWLELVVTECKKGWYGLQGEKCLFCEDEEPGAVCPGGERFRDLVYSKAGWWRVNDTTPSTRCHPKRQNRKRCPVFLPCEPQRACSGNNTCVIPYKGFRCSECAKGSSRVSGLCKIALSTRPFQRPKRSVKIV